MSESPEHILSLTQLGILTEAQTFRKQKERWFMENVVQIFFIPILLLILSQSL